jgi:hypothetical protein
MITKYDAVLALVGLEKNFGVTANGVLEWYESSNDDKPSEAQIQAKIAELQAAEPLRQLRQQRNQLLQQSDWRMVADYPGANQTEWKNFRQALRDITTQTPSLDSEGNLTGITWPTPPND